MKHFIGARRSRLAATDEGGELLSVVLLAALKQAERVQRQRKWRKRLLVLGLVLLGLVLVASTHPSLAAVTGTRHSVVTTAPTPLQSSAPNTTSARSGQGTPAEARLSGDQAASNPCDITSFDAVNCAIDIVLGGLFGGFYSFVSGLIQTAEGLDFLIGTPANLTYQNPVVTAIFQINQGILGGILGLIIVLAGYTYMFGRYEDFREMIHGVIPCVILAFFSLSLLSQFLELEDQMSHGYVAAILPILNQQTIFDPFVNLGQLASWLIVFGVVEVVMFLLLSVQMLLRIALLDLLLILAPLGIMSFALPQTRAWGRLWADAFASALIVQLIQVLLISLGAGFVASPILGGGAISLLAGIATLYLAFKVPNWFLSRAVRSLSGGSQSFSRSAQSAGQAAARVAATLAA